MEKTLMASSTAAAARDEKTQSVSKEQDSLPSDDDDNDDKPSANPPLKNHRIPRFTRPGAILSTLYKNITCSENVPQTCMDAPATFFTDQFKALEDEQASLFASEKASVSWVRQIADQEPDICVLPPS